MTQLSFIVGKVIHKVLLSWQSSTSTNLYLLAVDQLGAIYCASVHANKVNGTRPYIQFSRLFLNKSDSPVEVFVTQINSLALSQKHLSLAL